MFLPPQADLTPWKNSSGRFNGQPTMLDCSGKAGIVEEGGWVVLSGWTVSGCGSGRVEMGVGR